MIAAAKFLKSAGSSRSGVAWPAWSITWAKMLPAMRLFERPKSIKTISVSSACPCSSFNCSKGVVVLRVSITGAKAEMIKETGDVTDFFSWVFSSSHCVRMDKESLPTGIEIPKAGHNSMPTALTESNNLASSPGLPHAAIQLADSLMSSMLLISADKILVMDSATAMRAAAGAFITAKGVLSPIDMASPR